MKEQISYSCIWGPEQRAGTRTACPTGSKSTDRGHKGLKPELQGHRKSPCCWLVWFRGSSQVMFAVSCFTLWVLQEHSQTIKLNGMFIAAFYKWRSRWCLDNIIWTFLDSGMWRILVQTPYVHVKVLHSDRRAQKLHKRYIRPNFAGKLPKTAGGTWSSE